MKLHVTEKLYSNPTYLYIANFYHKFTFFLQNKPEELEKLQHNSYEKRAFFDFFPKFDYLKKEESFYDSLYRIERDLEKRCLKHARETFYSFRTNTPDVQLRFIRQNFLPSAKKRRYIKEIKNNQSDTCESLYSKLEKKSEDHDSVADDLPF